MDDIRQIFEALKGPLGAVGAIAFATVLYFQNRRVKDADGGAQLESVAVYKKMLDDEYSKRIASDQRADVFAHERNEALQQVWELKGQLQAVLSELEKMRTELNAMREQLNAKQ